MTTEILTAFKDQREDIEEFILTVNPNHLQFVKLFAERICIDYRYLFIKRRFRQIVEKRFMVMNAIYTGTHYSLECVGEVFGVDHTSVIHAVATHKDLISTCDNYRTTYNLADIHSILSEVYGLESVKAPSVIALQHRPNLKSFIERRLNQQP